MQLCRQFLYSLFECRFTAPGTQCAFGSAPRKLSPCSLGCRQLKIMGILAKVFTPNVDFSRSHTPRHSTLKDVLSPYPQVRSTATVKTERRNTKCRFHHWRQLLQLPICFIARSARSRYWLKYYNERKNCVRIVSTSVLETEIFRDINIPRMHVFFLTC